MSLRKRTLHIWRRITQVVFGIFFTNGYIPVIWTKTLYSGPLRQICVPALNCHSCPTATMACPIGMMQHYAGAHQIPWFIVGFLGSIGLVFGRAACGWLCPFGLLQDLMFKIKSVKIRIPKFFSYFKYVFLLVLVIILPYYTDVHWFSRLCPWGGLIGAIPWVAWNPMMPEVGIPTVPEGAVGHWFVVKMIIVAFFLILFIVAKRPFCYTSCPLGAIYSFFNRFSLIKVDVDENCTKCDHCREKCPADLAAYEKANHPTCVECYECTGCEHVSVKMNFDTYKLPFRSKPEIGCSSGCPLGTEAWRYVAHIQNGEYQEAYKALREPNPFPSVCAHVCDHPCESRCDAGKFDEDPVAIRALKRFVTENVDPAVYQPVRLVKKDAPAVAVIGAGPAGLTAAHLLSVNGYQVTVFEKGAHPGGMLLAGIPEYRLPKKVMQKDIDQLLDENITLKYNTALGKDFSTASLKKDGFSAVFIATGAHISRKLGIQNENTSGVYPSMQFLKEFNVHGTNLAKGKVAVIGGGNAAIDSARVAVRQKNVSKVTILYRRSRAEMPAYDEEVESALAEGVKIKNLVSPLSIVSANGKVTGIGIIRNRLEEAADGGRKRPVPMEGSEQTLPFDTVIVAISEQPDLDALSTSGINIGRGLNVTCDPHTLQTNIEGVFAGGDTVTGPNTVVDAIAAGKRAFVMIDRYLTGQPLAAPVPAKQPQEYIQPYKKRNTGKRVQAETESAPERKNDFRQCEKPLSEEAARKEAARCLRCDLKFTGSHRKSA